jgi:hypothetical protein
MMTEQIEAVEPKPKAKRGPKPRQQSAAGLSAAESTRLEIPMGEGRDPNEQVLQERVRVPLGEGQDQWLRGYKLDWDNFHYHLFHESSTRGGRVAKADQAFYEHCQVNGENLRRPAGNGWDYLMKLPKKYWAQDMAASRARREALRKSTQTIQGDEKLQEYGIDSKGRPVFAGETPVKRSSSVAHNPYSE